PGRRGGRLQRRARVRRPARARGALDRDRLRGARPRRRAHLDRAHRLRPDARIRAEVRLGLRRHAPGADREGAGSRVVAGGSRFARAAPRLLVRRLESSHRRGRWLADWEYPDRESRTWPRTPPNCHVHAGRRQALAARAAALVLSVALAASCESPSRSADRLAVRDSAGVRITTHVPDQPRDAPPAPEPILSIGREGDSRYEFFGVVKAAPLGNGNVAVANGGSGELRFYDPDGAYLRS